MSSPVVVDLGLLAMLFRICTGVRCVIACAQARDGCRHPLRMLLVLHVLP